MWSFYGTLSGCSSNDVNKVLIQLICFFLTVVLGSDYILYILLVMPVVIQKQYLNGVFTFSAQKQNVSDLNLSTDQIP